MKHIFLNLKRFDIPVCMGGVNCLAPINQWGKVIVSETQDGLDIYDPKDVEFAIFFPEAHLISAVAAKKVESRILIGCEGVYREDTSKNGNFGAFTTNRPAAAMKALGCEYVLIGHCEERNDKIGILQEAGLTGEKAMNTVNRILNREIRAALDRGLKVLYCIGERSEEQEKWKEVLGTQLSVGLEDTDKSRIVIGYEPVWSIGPGKTPAGRDYIQKIARWVKERTGGMDVVYGGGLKQDNAQMLASIPEINGGLIALTRFTGKIGFYPNEYLEITKLYLNYNYK